MKTIEHYYIRFGAIPKNERSKIGNGIIGDGYECVGYESGVSVWDCVKIRDKYCIVIPHGNSCTHGDISSMAFPDDCCGCSKDDLIYIVEGNEVGIGSDGEPLIKDVRIIEQLPYNYFSFDRQLK